MITEVNKAALVDDLKEQFEKSMILVNDEETLQQMQMFVEGSKGEWVIKKEGVIIMTLLAFG